MTEGVPCHKMHGEASPSGGLDAGRKYRVTADDNAGAAALEQPILWLGMAGFAAQQRVALAASLQRSAELPRWRVCAFGDADAWWVNGTHISLLPSGNLKVAAGLPTERALSLNLEEVDRPVAFATPLASPDLEPRCAFDPQSRPSIEAVLLQFDQWLRLLRSQFVLGRHIALKHAELGRGVYHLNLRGQLLAVLDFHDGKVALSPAAHPVDLWEAQWQRRPIGGRDLPPKFLRVTPAQLAWTYVRHSDRELLPQRYRTDTVYYRRVPQVPVGWLRDSQLLLLRELAAEPGNVESLRQRTALPLELMRHDLTCLYYAGAITTTRGKAAKPLASRQDSQPHSCEPALNSLLREGTSPSHPELTAPALLEHRQLGAPRRPSDSR